MKSLHNRQPSRSAWTLLLSIGFLFVTACTHLPKTQRSIAAISCDAVFAELQTKSAPTQGLVAQDARQLVAQNRLQEAAWLLRQIGDFQRAADIETKIEQELLNSPIVSVMPFFSGREHISEAYIVTLKSGLRGFFKPAAEFWREKDSRNGILANPRAEVMAYTLNKELELNAVPVTVLRDVKNMKGSLQVFVDLKTQLDYSYNEFQDPVFRPKYFEIYDEPLRLRQRALSFFDYLTYNTDRHSGNLETWSMANRLDPRALPGQGFGLVAIDNGAAFQNQNIARGNHPPKSPWSLDVTNVKPFRRFFETLLEKLPPEKIQSLMQDHFEQEIIDQTIERRKFLLNFYKERSK